jgi:hypothetical protein
VETCKALFEKGFPYLELNEEGKIKLYGILAENVETHATFPKRPRKQKNIK